MSKFDWTQYKQGEFWPWMIGILLSSLICVCTLPFLEVNGIGYIFLIFLSVNMIVRAFLEKSTKNTEMLFKRKNYMILIIGIFILFLGFILLSGGGSDDYEYNKSIFNFQRQVLAPIFIITSLVLCGFSIMLKK